MIKENFCVFAETLLDYSLWERKLYECGVDLTDTPAARLVDNVWSAMVDFDPSFSYDEKLGFDWIIEWTCGNSPFHKQYRHGQWFDLDTAGQLYEFLVFMNEHGWEDE